MSRKAGWMDSQEATRLLDVSRATLYAYVSRGHIRSRPVPGKPRERSYAREDVDRLRLRSRHRRAREKPSPGREADANPAGAISRVAGGKLFYRGHEATELARNRSLEDVASLIWTGSFGADVFDTPLHVVGGAGGEDLPVLNRAQSVLPLVAARDPLARELDARGVARTGWRVLNLLTSVAAESRELEPTVEETLARAWAPGSDRAAPLIRAALILCADEGLNAPVLAARCVASAGSNPYAVVLAGLAALEGPKHGGVLFRIDTLFDELRRVRDPRKALAGRGPAVDGFGHRSYPGGDPRAVTLLAMLPPSRERVWVESVVAAARKVTGEEPALELALVALSRVLEFPRGAAAALLAIGRTIGWIAHAIEEYAREETIPPAKS